MKRFIFILILMPILSHAQQTLSLDDCYNLVNKNYPIAKQVNLLQQKSDIQVDVNNKNKLPKIELNAQATLQNQVPSLPGQVFPTINKDQYKGSLDVNQLIYNGRMVKANSKLLEAQNKTQQQQVEVNLYQLKSKINQLYFSILLLQEQKNILISKQDQLLGKVKELKTGIQQGAILPASEKVLEAENLKLKQQLIDIQYEKKKMIENLSSLTFSDINENTTLAKPIYLAESNPENNRPELKFYDFQREQIEASKVVESKNYYPKITAFGTAGYGNPGLNFILNSFQPILIAGVRANWTVFDWNKIKKDKEALSISADIVATEKETFLLNTNLQLQEIENEIKKIQETIETDTEIIGLRKYVEQSAGSQMRNGTITASDYLIEFTNLYEAEINQKMHEIQLDLSKANYRVNKGL